MVAPMRFELMASGLGILRSILLSYGVAARGHSKSGDPCKPARGGPGWLGGFGSARGAAGDEAGGNDKMLGGNAALDALDQQARRLQAKNLAGLVDRGEGVLGQLAPGGVVVADDGKVARHGQAEFARDADD